MLNIMCLERQGWVGIRAEHTYIHTYTQHTHTEERREGEEKA